MKILKLILSISSAMILMIGCTTNGIGSDNSINMKINSDGSCTINNQVFPQKQLPKQLKKLGGNSQTKIYIKLPPNADKNMLISYGATLKQNGFGRYIFSGPRRTTYTIKEE